VVKGRYGRNQDCFFGIPAVVFDNPPNDDLGIMLGRRFERAGFLVIWLMTGRFYDHGFFTLKTDAPALQLRWLAKMYAVRFVYTEDPYVKMVARELGIMVIPWSIFRGVKIPLQRIPIPEHPPEVVEYG
jgi:hypothetical protein